MPGIHFETEKNNFLLLRVKYENIKLNPKTVQGGIKCDFALYTLKISAVKPWYNFNKELPLVEIQ